MADTQVCYNVCMPRKYTEEQLVNAVRDSVSMAQVMRALGIKQAGGSHSHLTRTIKKLEINTDHFTGQAHNRGKPSLNKRSPDERLVVLPEGSARPKVLQLRQALLSIGVSEICSDCGLGTEWNGKPIRLEIDHVNSNWLDNRRENLQWLCPNCHCQKTRADVAKWHTRNT